MIRRIRQVALLLIALTPVIFYAQIFEGLNHQTVYFYTDGLPIAANPYLVRLWFYPIIALMAVEFNFVHRRLRGPFLQNIVRYRTRGQIFSYLYATKMMRQMGTLMVGLIVYLLARIAFGYAVWLPNLARLTLSLVTFLLLFSLQFVGELFFEPLMVYIGLNVYVFVSISLPGVNAQSIAGFARFPNALMAIRIQNLGLYYIILLSLCALIILIGRRRFSKMDLL